MAHGGTFTQGIGGGHGKGKAPVKEPKGHTKVGKKKGHANMAKGVRRMGRGRKR